MGRTTVHCSMCAKEIDPDGRMTFRRIDGWEQPRARGGANVIHLRRQHYVFACWECINSLKKGFGPDQGSLL